MRENATDSCLAVPNASKTLAPIHRLPIEILSKVLALVAQPSLCIFTNTEQLAVHPFAAIPSVCTTWHHLVLNNRLLWTHIDIDNTRIESDRGTHWLDRIKLWLDRSSGAPLHLHFQFEYHSNESDDGPPVGGILLHHMPQVVSLACSGLSHAYFYTFLNLYAAFCSPGHLETLSIENMEIDPHMERSYWPTNILWDLSVLELVDIHKHVCPRLDEIASILSGSPRLHTLRLVDVEALPRQYPTFPDIRLPKLEFFELILFNPGNLEQLLTALVPGTLELKVRLKMPLTMDSVGHSAICAFLRRSNVVYLDLADLYGPIVRNLAKIFDCVPQLRSLSIDWAENYSFLGLAALNAPTEGERARARCTKLTTFRLDNAILDVRAWQDLKEIVDTHRLEKILIISTPYDSTGNINVPILDWIRKRVKDVVYEDARC